MSKWARRVWLNKEASAVAMISPSIEYQPGEDPWMTADIKISDCNRLVNLEFQGLTKKDQERAMFKLGVLIDEITLFRNKLAVIHAKINKAKGQ